MTDTVSIPVPLDLLKELKASYRGSSREIDAPWNEVTTTLDGTAYDRVVALIPTPPKVGDMLDADEVRQLPPGAVLLDADDDVWVRYGVEKVYLAADGASSNRLPVSNFGPYTVIHLGSGD